MDQPDASVDVEVTEQDAHAAEITLRGELTEGARRPLVRAMTDLLLGAPQLRRAGEPYQLTPTALMRTALVTSGAITQRLDRLEEKGLITRGRSDADGRAVVVTLTDAGRTALDAALPDHLETERGMLAGLTDDERDQLGALLRRWLVALGRVPGGIPDPS